jgi:sulfotransferase
MKQIYAFLNEPYFEHDFNNVEASYDEFDEQTKIIGLHKVRQKVEFRQRQSILPSDLQQQYAQSSFWKYNFDQSKKLLNWIQSNKTINITKPAPNIGRQL